MDEYGIIKNTLENIDNSIFLNINDNGLDVYISNGIENKDFIKINTLFHRYHYILKRIDALSGYDVYVILEYVVVAWVKKHCY